MICMFVRATIELTLTSAHVRCALQELQQQPLGGRPGRLGPALVVAAGRHRPPPSASFGCGSADALEPRCVGSAPCRPVGLRTHSASPTCLTCLLCGSRNPAIKVSNHPAGRSRGTKMYHRATAPATPNTDCGDLGHMRLPPWHRRAHTTTTHTCTARRTTACAYGGEPL